MGATPLENELMQCLPKLTIVQQEALLGLVKSMIQPEAEIDIDQYNREIDAAVARVESGQFYTQEEVENMSKGW